MEQGKGDIEEIRNRRTWREVNYWESHKKIQVAVPVKRRGKFRRNEYLYVGRSKLGVLTIDNITITGSDAKFFSIDKTSAKINKNEYMRLKVSYVANHKSIWRKKCQINAAIEFASNIPEMSTHTIPIVRRE